VVPGAGGSPECLKEGQTRQARADGLEFAKSLLATYRAGTALGASPVELARSCHYAIKGLAYLAGREHPEEPVLLRDIAAAVDAPEAFLSKIFQSLRGAGIVRSHRGTSRGYGLARDASSITLYDVIVATEGPASLHAAPLAEQEVGPAFAGIWQEVEEVVEKRLRATTLRDLQELSAQGK
jgi:Rrf2 family protein